MMSGPASWWVSSDPVPATRADEGSSRTGQHIDRMYPGGTHGQSPGSDAPNGLPTRGIGAPSKTPCNPVTGGERPGLLRDGGSAHKRGLKGRARYPRPRSRRGKPPNGWVVGESSGAGAVSDDSERARRQDATRP